MSRVQGGAPEAADLLQPQLARQRTEERSRAQPVQARASSCSGQKLPVREGTSPRGTSRTRPSSRSTRSRRSGGEVPSTRCARPARSARSSPPTSTTARTWSVAAHLQAPRAQGQSTGGCTTTRTRRAATRAARRACSSRMVRGQVWLTETGGHDQPRRAQGPGQERQARLHAHAPDQEDQARLLLPVAAASARATGTRPSCRRPARSGHPTSRSSGTFTSEHCAAARAPLRSAPSISAANGPAVYSPAKTRRP